MTPAMAMKIARGIGAPRFADLAARHQRALHAEKSEDQHRRRARDVADGAAPRATRVRRHDRGRAEHDEQRREAPALRRSSPC